MVILILMLVDVETESENWSLTSLYTTVPYDTNIRERIYNYYLATYVAMYTVATSIKQYHILRIVSQGHAFLVLP